MNWRDLLYFSNGERRALTLLVCLIAISWILLLLTDNRPEQTSYKTDKISEQAKTVQTLTANNPNPEKAIKPASERKSNSFRKKTDFHPKETPHIPGRKTFPKTEKYPVGTIVELNTADTASLKKVPGIGSTFAKRIIKYRELLGGFYSVAQLCEVYGMDEERYNAMKSWFSTNVLIICELNVNQAPIRNLYRHPYINKQQARIIEQLRKQKGKIDGWENLRLLEEFTEKDRERLTPYLSFE